MGFKLFGLELVWLQSRIIYSLKMCHMKTEQNYKSFMSIPINNIGVLEEIKNKLSKSFQGKREIMYSDIINLIIREGKVGNEYNELILWCNYKIRLGETFVES